jgi:hypothetical protein
MRNPTKRKGLLIIAITGMFLVCCSQSNPLVKETSENPLQRILQQMPAEFGALIQNPDAYRLQILYTQIERDAANQPHLRSYEFNLQPDRYFYPASSIKLPVAALALEKLNELNIPGLTKYTPLTIDSAAPGQSPVTADTTSEDGKASIAHYIKKILLVSDNDAYNRLFEFVGQAEINRRLKAKGYEHTKIIRRLSVPGTPDQQRYTNPFTFYRGDSVIYHQPMAVNPEIMTVDMSDVKQGRGYIRDGKLVPEPLDFRYSNYMSVKDLQKVVVAIMLPEVLAAHERFNLAPDDYRFLRTYMGLLPRESKSPVYNATVYENDGNAKNLIFGDVPGKMPPHIRIFSKSGGAYGYMIENAYIADFKNGVEFLLTVVLQVNENQIYNDDIYEYDTLGKPFLAALGRAVYQYELQRPRAVKPDLSKFSELYDDIIQ